MARCAGRRQGGKGPHRRETQCRRTCRHAPPGFVFPRPPARPPAHPPTRPAHHTAPYPMVPLTSLVRWVESLASTVLRPVCGGGGGGGGRTRGNRRWLRDGRLSATNEQLSQESRCICRGAGCGAARRRAGAGRGRAGRGGAGQGRAGGQSRALLTNVGEQCTEAAVVVARVRGQQDVGAGEVPVHHAVVGVVQVDQAVGNVHGGGHHHALQQPSVCVCGGGGGRQAVGAGG